MKIYKTILLLSLLLSCKSVSILDKVSADFYCYYSFKENLGDSKLLIIDSTGFYEMRKALDINCLFSEGGEWYINRNNRSEVIYLMVLELSTTL